MIEKSNLNQFGVDQINTLLQWIFNVGFHNNIVESTSSVSRGTVC